MDEGFEEFSRTRWSALGIRTGSPLSASETEQLTATGEPVSIEEVVEVYLPLSELLTLLANVKRSADEEIGSFLADGKGTAPFVIGIAGSVAVGKSTTARVLQALLRESPGRPIVELLTTDGFLYPNATLEARGLMNRKGFPESYDQRALIHALAAIRQGSAEVATPVYSHLQYDIVPGVFQFFRKPDMVIVEGLNVLQVDTKGGDPAQTVVSDHFDYSIYVDATQDDIARWFQERLLALRSTVLQEPDAFFHRFASLPEEEVLAIARQIWAEINLVNLQENIAPTRGRAHLILEKDRDHRVQKVMIRRP
jgi:type I pantothenate kinase